MFKERILKEMRIENQGFKYTEHEIEYTMKVLGFSEQIMEGERIPVDKRSSYQSPLYSIILQLPLFY